METDLENNKKTKIIEIKDKYQHKLNHIKACSINPSQAKFIN